MTADPVLNTMPMFEDEPTQESPTEETGTEPEFEPLYPNAGEWVSDWLLPHFRRNPARFRWDPQWWRYEEAGAVLEAMWASWEQSRVDPDPRVMATWFRDVFYPLLGHLTAADGPFWNYSDSLGRTDVPPAFLAAPPPPGWFVRPWNDL
ncbi:DUF4913 domain-containing protein [Micrococcus luteus]|nr:DUF4913 domain-containing protein [Micrococcus luteus]MCV7499014.1 DUF4913 domain-containing protein [Micrococcus luteus]